AECQSAVAGWVRTKVGGAEELSAVVPGDRARRPVAAQQPAVLVHFGDADGGMRIGGGETLHAFAPGILDPPRHGDVLHAVHRPDDGALIVEQRLDAGENPDPAAVAPLDDA